MPGTSSRWYHSNVPTAPQQLGSPTATFNRYTDPQRIDYSRINVGMQPLGGQPWQQASSYLARGSITDAQQVMDEYLTKHNSLNNYMSAVTALEQAGAPLSVLQTYRGRASEIAWNQIQQNPNTPLPWIAAAKFSLEDGERVRFHQAAQQFVQRFPEDQHANYFAGISALQNEDWTGAEAALKKAQRLGYSDEGINQLLKMCIDKQRWVWQFAAITGIIVAAWLLGLVVLYLAGSVMSSLVLRCLNRQDAEQAVHCSSTLRTMYRVLINVAGIYYYLSLPILVLISLALPLSLGYALLLLPSISLLLIGVVLLAGLGGLLTAISGIRACFVRLPREAPGQELHKADAPQLWSLARDVANQVETRAVDEIRILPGAEMFVLELGSYWERLHDRGRRVLVIGLRLVEDFDEQSFRCVLAHEYGHFLHRDTAGGDIAMQIYGSMEAFVQAILAKGPIRWWHASVHFLRFFHLLFRRLTFGASRLQEVRADYIAVKLCGPSALQQGLLHVIRQALAFDFELNEHVKDRVRSQLAPVNFYAPSTRMKLEHREQLDEAVDQIYRASSTPEETHPGPEERVRFARRLGVADSDHRGNTVARLFPQAEKLRAQFNAELTEVLEVDAAKIREVSHAAIQDLTALLQDQRAPEFYLHRARFYLDLGQYNFALADLEEIPAHSAFELTVGLGRATVYEASQNYAGVAEILKPLLKKYADFQNTENYLWLGQCCLLAELYPEAVDAFSLALNTKGNSVTALVGRGKSHAALGQRDHALTDFQRALQVSSSCAEAEEELDKLQRVHAAPQGAGVLRDHSAPGQN